MIYIVYIWVKCNDLFHFDNVDSERHIFKIYQDAIDYKESRENFWEPGCTTINEINTYPDNGL